MTDQLQLNLVSRETEKYRSDVILIHGLGGNSIDTWTSDSSVGKKENKKDFNSFFPAVLAADFPDTRIWTLGYSAAMFNWGDNPKYDELERVCINISHFIAGYEIGRKPLIFICHSLGGIVAKEILRVTEQSSERIKRIFDSTVAVSFIATPHTGSPWATILNNVNKVIPFFNTSDRMEVLEYDSAYLESLSASYRTIAINNNIETQAFCEQRKTKKIMVVPRHSANPNVDKCRLVGINKNHIDIAKPQKKDDMLYKSLCGLLNYHFYDDANTENIPPQTVVIGLVKRGNKVLMVNRRNPVDNLTWQFVAGRLKAGQETEGDCIVREILEETGIHAKVIKKLGQSDGRSIPYNRVYYSLNYLSGELINGDELENTGVNWIKIKSVRDFITSPLSKIVSDYLEI